VFLRRDPFAMLPFCGYNMADYFCALALVRSNAVIGLSCQSLFRQLFRKHASGKFSGLGLRAKTAGLKWICERVEAAPGRRKLSLETLPEADALDLSGLNLAPEDVKALESVDAEGGNTRRKTSAHIMPSLMAVCRRP